MTWGLVLAWLGSASAAPVETNELDALSLGRWGHDVPFDLPPAPRGMVPELRLTLDHGQLAGPVGLGWSLAGEHRVERRGAGGGVPAFDETDQLVLDGQPLHWTEGPGQSGYRLEVDDNRIVYKQLESGQEYWIAQRDG
jgi:hypothetical protein